jgi:hypothetical protein
VNEANDRHRTGTEDALVSQWLAISSNVLRLRGPRPSLVCRRSLDIKLDSTQFLQYGRIGSLLIVVQMEAVLLREACWYSKLARVRG